MMEPGKLSMEKWLKGSTMATPVLRLTALFGKISHSSTFDQQIFIEMPLNMKASVRNFT